MAGVFERLRGLTGWRRMLAGFGFGLASALAQAPFGLLPALLLAFPGLLLLLEGCLRAPRPLSAAFATGWAFGFGALALGTYWIAFAFLVQADQFAWMIPVIVPGLMAFLALYAGLAGWAAVLVWRAGGWGRTPLLRALSFASAWSLFEVLRGHLLTGFPWNIVSQSATAWLPLAQGAAWIGPYGLSLVMVALAGLPLAAARHRRWPWLALGSALALSALLHLDLIVGRSSTSPTPEASVVIVQPNVPQRDKLDPAKREANLVRTLRMTSEATAGHEGPAYVLWPENAYPYLSEQVGVGTVLAQLLPEQAILVTGSVRAYPGEAAGDLLFGNAVQVFGPTAAGEKPLAAVYDKHHLVPFGEYLPFERLFLATGLASMSPVGGGGFTPGPGPSLLAIGPAPFSPLVCYEDVFPGQLYPAGERPRWLAVVTNDAWFGDGAGPKQHLAIAQMRAIESGLPVARSANTGISALIDAQGQVLRALPLYEEGTIVAHLPPAMARTIYDRTGELGWALLLLLVAFSPRLASFTIRG
jgi:apolipoprotein N-acyltransferase